MPESSKRRFRTAGSKETIDFQRATGVSEEGASEKTTKFWQEVFDDKGNLVEIHEKYPVDNGHVKVPGGES